MAKNRNTFEKHRRELEKKRNAEEKRLRRKNRQNAAHQSLVGDRSLAEDEAPASSD